MSGKRKRESLDDSSDVQRYRSSPGANPNDFEAHYLQNTEDEHFAQALAQHNAGADHSSHDVHSGHDAGNTNGQSASDTATAALQHYSMTVPQPTADTFLAQNPTEPEGRPSSSSFDLGTPSHTTQQAQMYGLDLDLKGDQNVQPQPSEGSPNATPAGPGGYKPPVGSDEWHKVRRDNHKEVERRRRETINEGINELSKIVPGCEKNKGSILARAVQFITQLKENESQNIEKWTLEKLLTEQAIAELSSSCDKLKVQVARAYKDLNAWKQLAARTGAGEPTEEDRRKAEEADEE